MDDGRHGSDLGVTSVARHSEPSLTVVLAHLGEANVCTPRPASSRVTTADGRSPGSRVDTLRRLPRTEIPSGFMTKDSPLTAAGAGGALGKHPRTAFPFDPQTREPSGVVRTTPRIRVNWPAYTAALCPRLCQKSNAAGLSLH